MSNVNVGQDENEIILAMGSMIEDMMSSNRTMTLQEAVDILVCCLDCAASEYEMDLS